jgi:hypothetical protein
LHPGRRYLEDQQVLPHILEDEECSETENLTAREVIPNDLADPIDTLRWMVRVVVHSWSLETRLVPDIEIASREEVIETLHEGAVSADQIDEVVRVVRDEEALTNCLACFCGKEESHSLYSQEELS